MCFFVQKAKIHTKIFKKEKKRMLTYTQKDIIEPGSLKIRAAGSARDIKPKKSGDPFFGEVLTLSWESVRDGETELSVKLKERAFIDCVIIRTGEKTALRYARLFADGKLLSEHCAETGMTVTSHKIELCAGIEADGIVLSFCCDFSELSILSIDLYASKKERADLFPVPKKVCFGEKSISASSLTSYTANGISKAAGRVMSDKLLDLFRVESKEAAGGTVRFETDPDIPGNGYRLCVDDSGVLINASDERGFVIGAETLIKLIQKDGSIPHVNVDDSPFMPFRGVHLMAPSKGQLDFAKRLIRNVISPLGYNLVIIELAGLGMRFDSHPKINSSVEEAIERSERGEMPPFPHGKCVGGGRTVEKETLKEFIDYVRSFGLEVVPEVQSLGHVQFMTYTYPEIAETDQSKREAIDIRLADALPADVYPHCYCPSNPRSYEILFDIMDEIIALFAPLKYVHIGHDEVYQIGVCPKCKDTPPSELFYSDVMKIYDHLSARGLKVMMWADMLQPVTRYKTFDAAKKLPRDIIMLDFIWYFHLDKDIEENLLAYGYKVAFGNLYSSHFPRYESRVRREGVIGGQISTWVSTEEEAIQKEGKFYDFFAVAEMLWDEGYSHHMRMTYERMISSLMPGVRELIKGIRYPSLTLGNIREPLAGDGETVFVCRNEEVYQSLVFTHTLKRLYSRMPWKDQEPVGKYIITYSDGTLDTVTVHSGREVGYIGARPGEPLKNPLYRHNGYTASYECDGELSFTRFGERITVYRYEHLLLTGKPLKSVEWVQNSSAEPLSVLSVEGIKNANKVCL